MQSVAVKMRLFGYKCHKFQDKTSGFVFGEIKNFIC